MTRAQKRQLFQSIIQGLTVAGSALAVLGRYPSLEELYLATLGGLLGALAIFGASKMPVGEKPK